MRENMIKKLLILCFIIVGTSTIQAHCGSCGVGDEKKSHSHTKEEMTIKDLNLTKKQSEQYEKIKKKHKSDLATLEENFETNVLEILTKKQKEKYKENNIKCSVCDD